MKDIQDIPERRLLAELEQFFADFGVKPTMFGKRLGDPNLIKTLRSGRELRSGTRARVYKAMRDIEAAQ